MEYDSIYFSPTKVFTMIFFYNNQMFALSVVQISLSYYFKWENSKSSICFYSVSFKIFYSSFGWMLTKNKKIWYCPWFEAKNYQNGFYT